MCSWMYSFVFLNILFSFLNDMSFLTILSLISLNIPGVAKTIQIALLQVIYIDILQTDSWLSPLIFPDTDSDA
jgi:hypothetical protein